MRLWVCGTVCLIATGLLSDEYKVAYTGNIKEMVHINVSERALNCKNSAAHLSTFCVWESERKGRWGVISSTQKMNLWLAGLIFWRPATHKFTYGATSLRRGVWAIIISFHSNFPSIQNEVIRRWNFPSQPERLRNLLLQSDTIFTPRQEKPNILLLFLHIRPLTRDLI